MNEALGRARRGALILGCVFVFSIMTFHLWFKKTLLESIYWTVITVAGVGYSQSVDQEVDEARQFLSIIVIIFGMMAMMYTVGMLIQAIVEGQLDQAMGVKRMTKKIDKLKDHVIICGFGRIGQNLGHRLVRHQVPFVVIEPSSEVLAEAKSLGYLYLEGDATDEDTLLSAGIERATTFVIALQSDATNVFLTLTARNMNPAIHILARGEHPRTEKKLLQAGANEVVMPAIIGAERMADIIVRPETSDLLRCIGHESGLNAELEEFKFTDKSAYLGRTIREAEEGFQMMVIAVRSADGETVFNPKDDQKLCVGDIVIVMGPEADIEEFYNVCVASGKKQPVLA
ncbi:MAG: potassium channel protein [Planctomycetes bacterium]|nr:potassium channel protein [Planctomycetota bacterium]